MPTEIEIQKGLMDYLALKGFKLIHHEGFSIGSPKGLPDIVAARSMALVAIECKGPRGQVRPEQREWIRTLQTIRGCVFAEIVGPTTTENWLGYDEALAELEAIL